MAIARRGEKADNAVAAVAPVAVRRNSRRLHEIAFSICREDPRSRKQESSGNLLRLESSWLSKGSIFVAVFQPETGVYLHVLFCVAVPWIVSYFFRLRIFMFYLFEDCEVRFGQLLLAGATIEEEQTIIGTIVIGAKGESLIEFPDGIRDPNHLAAQTLLAQPGRTGDSFMESVSWLAK
jgi:hypothetical protein